MFQYSRKKKLLFLLVLIFALLVVFVKILSLEKILQTKLDTFKKLPNQNSRNTQRNAESERNSFGENGTAVYLTDQAEIKANQLLYEKSGVYAIVSNKISINRTIPDTRPLQCLAQKYSLVDPKVSIIIIFHNEVFSILKRTLHSIWNRTPHRMIHEIILVNDASSEDELFEPLNRYVAENFGAIVKIKHLEKRKGLIVTRLEGARIATGDILVFFDSHVEVNYDWLQPLIAPITLNRKIATVPVVDDFSSKTFEYFGMLPTRGAFDWTFTFKELFLRAFEENSIEPFKVPVMLGCAFAIDRKFFLYDLGGYDEGLEIWNGEQLELSFKLHLCAEGLFKVPCSHVGHTFRDINPTRVQDYDFVAKNFKRIAEVWLDEFKEILYAREPDRYVEIDAGDLSIPQKIHERLNCKPFKEFLKIAPDMIERYPPFYQVPVFASGAIKSLAGEGNLCLSGNHELEDPLTLKKCSSNLIEPKKNQNFALTFFKQIAQVWNDYCLDSKNLSLMDCHYDGGNQFWRFEPDSGIIRNKYEDGNFCIGANVTSKSIFMAKCDEDEDNQKWQFGFLNETAMIDWDEINGFATFL